MFSNDSKNISQIYNNILINEISSKFVEEVKDAVQSRTLPFDNIFDNKLRITIPMEGLESYDEILDKIKQIKDYTGFDKDKKEVIREIPIDPKYGGGVKTQRIKLGKAIQSLKIDAENKKIHYKFTSSVWKIFSLIVDKSITNGKFDYEYEYGNEIHG